MFKRMSLQRYLPNFLERKKKAQKGRIEKNLESINKC